MYSYEGIKTIHLSLFLYDSSHAELSYITRPQELKGLGLTEPLIKRFASDYENVKYVTAYYVGSNFRVMYLKLAEYLNVELSEKIRFHLDNDKLPIYEGFVDPVRIAFNKLSYAEKKEALSASVAHTPVSKSLVAAGFKYLKEFKFGIEPNVAEDYHSIVDTFILKVTYAREEILNTKFDIFVK